MNIFSTVMIGIGLSMDAAAISMSNAMSNPRQRAALIEMTLWFAVFQGLMPVLGYFLGSLFSEVVMLLGKYLVFFILGGIGAKMIRDSYHNEDVVRKPLLTHSILLLQAVATSIDALAVGVALRAQGVRIFYSALIIAAVTLVITLCALYMGRRFGDMLSQKAELLGGTILILIGIKSLF